MRGNDKASMAGVGHNYCSLLGCILGMPGSYVVNEDG